MRGSFSMRCSFSVIFISFLLYAPSLSAQALRIEDEKLAVENGYRCGYWQHLLLSYRTEEGVEGELTLSVGTLRFRKPFAAPAHSSGVVKIPFFIPYPDAPMRLIFKSEFEEIHYPEVVGRIRRRLGAPAERLIGYFGESPLRLYGTRTLIHHSLLDEPVYLRQLTVVVLSTTQKKRLSEAVREHLKDFVRNGGCVVEIEEGSDERWRVTEEERYGAGFILKLLIPVNITVEEMREVTELLERFSRKKTQLRNIKAVPPPPHGDSHIVWFIFLLTFSMALGYVALTLHLHPRYLQAVLPITLSLLFSLLVLFYPSAPVWVVETEITLLEGTLGLSYHCLFVGGYRDVFWSPEEPSIRFMLPVDVETGRVVAAEAVYEDGCVVEMRLNETPKLLVKGDVSVVERRASGGESITNTDSRDWDITYLFKGIWAHDYGSLKAGESISFEDAVRRLPRSRVFSEIMDSTGLDIRAFVRNSNYIVGLSGRKHILGSGARWIVAPTITFVRTD